MRTCASCGLEQDERATFCAECGAYVGWDGGTRAPVTRPAPTAAPSRPAVPAHSPPVEAEPPRAAEASPLPDAHEAVDNGRRLALDHGRTDLAQGLDAARRRWQQRSLPVAVVGEFKRGKSTLVNALLRTDVCPVDADIVTAVPTIVRYGENRPRWHRCRRLRRRHHRRWSRTSPSTRLAELVSESRRPGERRRLRSVEVRLPHRLLQTGLCLVDTPGVGGLDSAHGILTLGALGQADGADLRHRRLPGAHRAGGRLPAPGARALPGRRLRGDQDRPVPAVAADRRARPRAPADAGIDLAVIAGVVVPAAAGRAATRSSTRSRASPRCSTSWPRTWSSQRHGAGAAAAHRELGFVAGAAAPAGRGRAARCSANPEEAERGGRGSCGAASERTRRLTSAAATWQQILIDGIQDLIADVEHDLRERLRTVVRDVEAVIDQGDPKDDLAGHRGLAAAPGRRRRGGEPRPAERARAASWPTEVAERSSWSRTSRGARADRRRRARVAASLTGGADASEAGRRLGSLLFTRAGPRVPRPDGRCSGSAAASSARLAAAPIAALAWARASAAS